MAIQRRRPLDCNAIEAPVGSRVRVLLLSGDWYENLPQDERPLVHSTVRPDPSIELTYPGKPGHAARVER